MAYAACAAYLDVALDEQRVHELVEAVRAVLTVQVDLVLVQHFVLRSRPRRSVLDARHEHRLDGQPVHEDALQRAAAEARRLQVVLRHVRVYATGKVTLSH